MASPFPPPSSSRPNSGPTGSSTPLGLPPLSPAVSTSGDAPAVVPADAPPPRRPRIDVVLVGLLFAGVIALLVGAVLVADQVVPTSSHEGRVTETERTQKRREAGSPTRQYSYSIRGVDDDGGTFRMGVSEQVWQRADEGDRVTVERSVLTGRVVDVVGDDWEVGREGWRVLMAAAVLALGVVLTAMALGASRRRTVSAGVSADAAAVPKQPVAPPVIAAIVVVVVWLAIERFVVS